MIFIKKKVPFSFVIPALVAFSVVRIIPMLISFYFSFTDWDGFSFDANFTGLKNYSKFFNDPQARNALMVTAIFVISSVIVLNLLALLIAVLLNEIKHLSVTYRTLVFIPMVLSPVAVGFIWTSLYSYDGLINYILNTLNLFSGNIGWLTDPNIALIAVIIVNIWQNLGFHVVVLFAAVLSIPTDVFEASMIDGVNSWEKFRYITLPLLKPGLIVSVIFSTISSLKQYDLIKVMTDGGPMQSTEVLSVKIIKDAFIFNESGYGATISFVLLFIIMTVTVIQYVLLNRKDIDY